jgi:cell division protein FtsZ
VKAILTDAGSALMGVGHARGDNRAVEAARAAISSPLLESSIDGARGILLNITGGSDLTLYEVNEAARIISDHAHPEANVIFGAAIDDSLGDEVRVTVIAAGFERWSTREVTTSLALEEEEEELGQPARRTLVFDADEELEDIPSFLRR